MANFGGLILTNGVDALSRLRWRRALRGFSRQVEDVLGAGLQVTHGNWRSRGTYSIGVFGLDDYDNLDSAVMKTLEQNCSNVGCEACSTAVPHAVGP